MITSTEQLREQFSLQAAAADLRVECAMSGSYLSKIAVIAEAPGGSEVAQGMPLVGASGRLFWDAARKHAKLARNDCYVTNVSKRQVAFSDGVSEARKPISKNELTAWHELLLWELKQLPNLKYVVLLGNYALEALTGNKGITGWRGSVLDIKIGDRDIRAIVMNNPALCMRDQKMQIVFNMDAAKIDAVLSGKFKPHPVHVHINPTFSEAIQWLDKMEREDAPISVDIESIQGETACIGFANNAHTAMCIPFRNESMEHYWTHDQEKLIRQRIQRLAVSPRARFIMQNGHFDCTWLWFKDKIKWKPLWFDTMLAHHTLYPTMPHGLGFICTQYTNHPYYKDDKDDWRSVGDVNRFWTYNGKDCCITWAAAMGAEGLLYELRDQNLYNFFVEHVMRMQPHLILMTVGGIRVDMSLKQKISEELKLTLEERLAKFHAAVAVVTGDPDYKPNPRSPPQMTELYFTRMKLVGRGTSTDAQNRELMFKHPRTTPEQRAVLQAVNEYAEDAKFYSTYAEMQGDADGRMRTEYKQIGVTKAPGRLSSGQTMWGSGGNLQNQPDRAKPMYIADEGYCFVYIDGSQAEARVVGWKAPVPSWIVQFERARLEGGYDAHCALASDMFGIPYDDVPTFDRYDEAHPVKEGDIIFPGGVTVRFVSKRCRHGLNYRMQADRLAMTTGLPIGVAQDAYAKYHRVNPEVRQWWQATEKEVREKKMLFNAFGRRYLQLETPDEHSMESIVAFYPQSTVGDLLNKVIYKCHDDPKWPKCSRIVLNIHDALIALSRIDDWKQTARCMVRHAEQPLDIAGRTLIIPADAAVSQPDEKGIHRWSTIKKVKRSELGL